MEEIWKDIEGYEGLYKVSNMGKVYSVLQDRILSIGNSKKGYDRYVVASLRKDGVYKNYPVHRLVAQAFIPNPDNFPIVHHIDTDKKNNRVDNLQWCTQKENVAHCIANGNFGNMRSKYDKKHLKNYFYLVLNTKTLKAEYRHNFFKNEYELKISIEKDEKLIDVWEVQKKVIFA